MKKRTEGFYVLLDVSAEPAPMAELDRTLALADEVIRHKTIRLPEAVAGQARSAAPPEPVAEAAPERNGA